jgi:hypothetical protein
MAAGEATSIGSPKRRSRITRGSKLLPSVHEQSVWARVVRDVLDAVVAHCGGVESPSCNVPRRGVSQPWRPNSSTSKTALHVPMPLAMTPLLRTSICTDGLLMASEGTAKRSDGSASSAT